MTISELMFPFPCPDISFCAHNGDRFLSSLADHDPYYLEMRHTFVCEVVEHMFDNSSDRNISLSAMIGLNGFLLISGAKTLERTQMFQY